jgi:hypothetical protein
LKNNHWISDTFLDNAFCYNGVVEGTCADVGTATDQNNIQKVAIATAAGQGYTSLNKLAPTAADSPTVNQGTTVTGMVANVDYLGVSRPQGAAWDIGAYEYVSGTTTYLPFRIP